MKLLCNVSIGNRSAPSIKRKSGNSTLALCKQPGSGDFCIILFSAQNKSGTKYNLKNNVQQIFSRCVNEGKSTIQFKQPPHDISIQADSIQLKCFLRLLKLALENKVQDSDLAGYSSMAVTPVAKKHIPPKRLQIRRPVDYPPQQGFHKSLEELHINLLDLSSVSPAILNLKCLRVLDLSSNAIKCIPEALNSLPYLEELNISKNSLGSCSPKQWTWMGGHLSCTLKVLEMSRNHLKYLPNQIVKLCILRVLNVNHNNIVSLPSGIGKLKNLKVLSAAYNSISSLPGSAEMLRLQELDLSYNDFPPNGIGNFNSSISLEKPLRICSLKEYAARQVVLMKVPYTPLDLPYTVIHYVNNAQFCVCGNPCFEVFVKHPKMFSLSLITVNFTVTSPAYVPMDCCYCSQKCFNSRRRGVFV